MIDTMIDANIAIGIIVCIIILYYCYCYYYSYKSKENFTPTIRNSWLGYMYPKNDPFVIAGNKVQVPVKYKLGMPRVKVLNAGYIQEAIFDINGREIITESDPSITFLDTQLVATKIDASCKTPIIGYHALKQQLRLPLNVALYNDILIFS